MRKLQECEAYFKDVYTDYIADGTNEDIQRLEDLKDTLEFIYGDSFRQIVNRWMQDAAMEYYREYSKVQTV